MKSFEGLYYKLFSIPKSKIMLTSSVATALLLSVLHRKIILLWFAVFLTSILSTKIIRLRFDLKRISFLSIFVSALSFPSLIVGGNIAASSFILFITMYFCSERKILSFPISAIPYLILSPSFNTLSLLIFSITAVLIYLKILNINVGKINIRHFVELFVLFWLTSKPEYMEKFLQKYSEEYEGRVRCLSIGDAKLVSSDFHPGPFRNVGGAKLVDYLSNANGLYLHSPTNHERNPASEEEVRKIAGALKCSGENLRPMKPFTISGKRFDIYCFPFDNLRLIFVSGKYSIDDFTLESENFVVDAHNAHKPNYDPTKDELKEISHLVEMAEKSEALEVSSFRYGFLKMYVETESICRYVASLLMEYDGEKYAIVIFDSNNIDLNFRNHVESLFGSIGYRTIVVSTDNHEKTGIRARQSYKPAGKCDEDWKIVEELVSRCKRLNLREGSCSYAEKRVKAKVMGRKLLEDAEVAAREKASPLIAKFLGFALILYLVALMV